MATTIAKGSLFPADLEQEIFNKVKGHSSIAKMSKQDAIPFVGKDVFVFSNAKGVEVVGENAAKSAGEGAVTSVSITPIKIVYQQRFSDEFMTASEEYKLNVLSTFADAFANALGAGLDKMAIHGMNPYSGARISNIATSKYFDGAVTTNVIEAGTTPTDTHLDAAVALVAGNDYVANGAIISPAMQSAIASLTANGLRKYPDFAFGAVPAQIGNMQLDVNSTVSATVSGDDTDYALVGDFSAFRWGIAKQLPLEVITYGDPDNQGDLKRYNQIVLRSEAYIGWGILDADAFALVTNATA